MVRADRHQLENALLNLAVNARDAMDGRGVLSIATRGVTLAQGEVGHAAPGDYVAIAVTDDGHGMDAAVQARVFEPFFTTKPAGKGTGLGLSQVFGTIRHLGGEVAIRSAPGEGTTITLYLRREPLAPPTDPPHPDIDDDDEPDRPLDILVVEDDPRVLRATVGALGELGHRPVACADPLAAADAAAAMPSVDLVVSDVVMPGRTGPEMVAGLRRARPDLRVLFVTGFAGEIGDDALGGEHVLRKPFTLAALGAAVAAARG
jgi:CheY-like chemotaxis protein